jgi:hypothetical protein
MRSTANLVVAHMLRSQLLGFALANFLLSVYALWACLTKARRCDPDAPLVTSYHVDEGAQAPSSKAATAAPPRTSWPSKSPLPA